MAISDFNQDSRPRFRRVGTGLALFIVFISTLTFLGSVLVTDIIVSATQIDDARSQNAARMSLLGLKSRISGTVQDNAVWNDAYEAINGSNAHRWIYDTWGSVSANYPLYDGVVILNADGSVFSGTHRGKPSAPSVFFRSSLNMLLQQTLDETSRAHAAFADTQAGIAVVAMQVIQRDDAVDPVEKRKVLVLYKLLDNGVLADIRQQQNLKGLVLTDHVLTDRLHLPVLDGGGRSVAALSWQSADPGKQLFEREKPTILLSILIVVLFFGAGTYLGFGEVAYQRRSARKAWALATHDSLSGLFNRGGFLHMVETRRADDLAAPGALFLLDLDGFKAVNDNWGHPVGDALIRLVAADLSTCDPDVELVGRFGGDEFALYSNNTARAREISDKVLTLFESPFTIRGLTIKVGVSIGVADSDGGITTEEMVRRADIALYEAKEKGKERAVLYDTVLGAEKAAEMALERDLRQAIAAGDIVPHFQPLIDARTRAVVGFEALARWNRLSAPVTPDRFIALAERAGLMDQLGESLLEQSLVEAGKWPDYTLSVNVSPLQLCNPRFPDQVRACLERTGFNPKRLSMEVTEGALISNPEMARQAIHQLKALGVTFALDDFGSGYASIGVLRQFGFDRIKIDRSLLLAADESDSGAAVIRATIALAQALDVPVTAEGVERQEQADFLTLSGCDQLQGYLLGRPASSSQIMQDLSNSREVASLARAS